MKTPKDVKYWRRCNVIWWSAKNEFCVFEHETFFINNLNVAKFPIEEEKMKLELIFKKLLTMWVSRKCRWLPDHRWIYIRKKIGMAEMGSDEILLHFKRSNLISASPTTPSNDFHVTLLSSTSCRLCSTWVVFELGLALVYFRTGSSLFYYVIA